MCHTRLAVKAIEVSVDDSIYKLMCCGSQQIHEQIITEMRMRRKRGKFLIMWNNGRYRGVCGSGV